ncbi:LysE family translocator [Angustibacter sp. Root456]|uniref:LysE family translocator n=1 Tax=Angustibacter sp. Root456 TaxID=1736539 RepID=UPI0006F8E855|nr:LysE family translocator [Angustibacter sp. Root456]KQX66022.1 lysine transporter LysE [Angustibacter sp. Root456]
MTKAVLAFSAAAALLVVLPGPDTMVLLRSIVRDGRPRAVWTAAGGLTGLVIWVSVAALGLSAVVRASELGYLALRIAGGLYLLWLGVQSLRRRPQQASALVVADAGAGARLAAGRGRAYLTGLLTDVLNPKVGAFFVSFLPAFVPVGHAVGAGSAVLGGVYIAETAVYYVALLAVSGTVVRWMGTPRVRRRLDRLMGLVFVAFGLRLMTEA